MSLGLGQLQRPELGGCPIPEEYRSFNITSLEKKARRLLTVLRKAKPTRFGFQTMETDTKLRQTRLAL